MVISFLVQRKAWRDLLSLTPSFGRGKLSIRMILGERDRSLFEIKEETNIHSSRVHLLGQYILVRRGTPIQKEYKSII